MQLYIYKSKSASEFVSKNVTWRYNTVSGGRWLPGWHSGAQHLLKYCLRCLCCWYVAELAVPTWIPTSTPVRDGALSLCLVLLSGDLCYWEKAEFMKKLLEVLPSCIQVWKRFFWPAEYLSPAVQESLHEGMVQQSCPFAVVVTWAQLMLCWQSGL